MVNKKLRGLNGDVRNLRGGEQSNEVLENGLSGRRGLGRDDGENGWESARNREKGKENTTNKRIGTTPTLIVIDRINNDRSYK